VNRYGGSILVELILYGVLAAAAMGTMWFAWSKFTGKYVDQGIAQSKAELQPKLDTAIKEKDAATAQKEEAYGEVRRLLGLNEDLGKRFEALVATNKEAFGELDRRTREAGDRARAAIVRAQASAARYEQDMVKLQAQARQRVTTPSAEQWPEAEALLRAAAARRALNLVEPPTDEPRRALGLPEPRLRLSP